MLIIKLIRWILGVLLMIQVWGHSHWSVALSITLLWVLIEFGALLVQASRRREVEDDAMREHVGKSDAG